MNAPTPANALDEPFVLREDADGVATLTLNRGERYNPLSSAMLAAISDALDAIAKDPGVRVVVLAAKGKGFSGGHDLKEMQAHQDQAWQQKLFDDCAAMMQKITRLPQPVIARVHGVATAAGCQLVSMCDLAVAADHVSFALSGINFGLFCSTPAVGVARNVSRKRAMEMLLLGDMIDAQTALQWGLVNRVVPADQLDAEIRKLTDSIKAKSPVAVAMGKEAFYRQIEMGLAGAYEVAGKTMTCNVLTADGAEGLDAFVGKRKPQWQGR